MEDNKKYQTEENLPKPKSMKKVNQTNTILSVLVLVLFVLGQIFIDTFGIILLLFEIPLAIAMIVLNLKNRSKR